MARSILLPVAALGVAAAIAIACGETSSSPAAPDAGPLSSGVDANVASDDAAAIDAAPPTAVCSESAARTPPVTLIVLPDQGETPFVNELTAATESIHILMYELGSSEILTTLEAKAQAGIDVRVIFDLSEQSNNQSAFDALQAVGAKVEWSDPQFTYMHAKIVAIDHREVIVSTGNFVASQMKEERNYAVIDHDPADVYALSALFDNDFVRAVPDLSCTRFLVSPVNSKPRILALINAATKSLAIESMEFADTDVRAAVVAKYKAGLDVRVLLADTNFVSDNASAETYLTQFGVPGRTLHTPTLHVKSIIVDGDHAYLGSENLSYTSLTQNREVGVEIYEANGEDVASMTSTFETDWAKAIPNPSLGGSTLDAGNASDASDSGM